MLISMPIYSGSFILNMKFAKFDLFCLGFLSISLIILTYFKPCCTAKLNEEPGVRMFWVTL